MYSKQQLMEAIAEGTLKASQEEFTSGRGRDRTGRAQSSGEVKSEPRCGQIGRRTGGQASGCGTHSALGTPQLSRGAPGLDASGPSSSEVQQGSGTGDACEPGSWVLE